MSAPRGARPRLAGLTRRGLVILGAAALAARAVAAPARPFDDLYACEGCDGVFERDPASLSWRAEIAGPDEPGERLRVEGVVRDAQGAAPVEGVIVYAYHTDAQGLYSRGTPETVWSRRHGKLRGWARTGPDGRYAFETIKPAPYPNEPYPAHVHLTVLEAGRRPYWIDDVVFAGEFGVDDAYRAARENRGGDGIVTLAREGDVWVARRDIRLEPHP